MTIRYVPMSQTLRKIASVADVVFTIAAVAALLI
jgi:hypothetical protein